MDWVNRLQEATGRHGPRREDAWAGAESELGTPLPADWKDLWSRFGPGSFSSYVFPLRDGEGRDFPLHWWRSLRDRSRQDPAWSATYVAPYTLYEPVAGTGLIMWGRSETGGRFFWLADRSADPATWPVVARPLHDEAWHHLPMSAAEFVHRAITDTAFTPFTVADPRWPPAFDPAPPDE